MQIYAATWVTPKSKHIQPFLTLWMVLNLTAVLAPKVYPFLLVGILERLYANPYFFREYILKKKERKHTTNIRVIETE